MEELNCALISPPALRPIVYVPEGDEGVSRLVLGVDSSLVGYGAILQQEDERGKRHPARYESGLWTETERRYDTGKLECRALLRSIKKFCNYLYGVHFLVETEAQTLVHQLNQPITDIPGAVGRWLAYIRLYSFDVVHVSVTKPNGPDSLSRRPATHEDLEELRNEEGGCEGDLEDHIEGRLGMGGRRDVEVMIGS